MPIIDARQYARQYAAFGIEVPSGARDAFAMWEAATAVLDTPTADLRAELVDGTLTAKNVAERLRQAALEAAARETTRSMLVDLDAALGRQAIAAFHADAGRTIEKLRPSYDAAADIVIDALGYFTAADYVDPNRLMAKGPEAASRWHRVSEALSTLDAIRALVVSLTGKAGRPSVSMFVTVTDEAAPDALAVAEAEAMGAGGPERWLRVFIVPGIRPALGSPSLATAAA